MKAATTLEQCQNLDDLIAEVVMDAEPTLLSSRNGQHAVLISLDEFNAWQETSYLLSNPANAAHLRRSIAEAEAGKIVERELIDP
jgi:antitoxin YefM